MLILVEVCDVSKPVTYCWLCDAFLYKWFYKLARCEKCKYIFSFSRQFHSWNAKNFSITCVAVAAFICVFVKLCSSHYIFFLFPLSVSVSKTDWQMFFLLMSLRSLPMKLVAEIGFISMNILANIFATVLFIAKFRLCEQSMCFRDK